MTPDLDLNFANPDNLADEIFFPALARIREHDPVFWSDYQRGWLLTRHADVVAGFSDPRLSAKRLHVNQFHAIAEADRQSLIPLMTRFVPDWVINVDDEQHARLRRLAIKAFTRQFVERLRPQIQALVDEMLDELADKPEIEFIEEVAFRLPATVIMRLLGLPDTHFADLRRWAREVTFALASQDPPHDLLLSAERCFVEMNQVFGAEFKKRRAAPSQDLMTELLLARDDCDALSEDELIGMCHVLLLAGHDTTANSLGLGLRAFLANPDMRAAYLANPQDTVGHITELLRYMAMSSAQVRIVTAPLELGGKRLKPGEIVFLMIAAANRDPTVFAEPDRMLAGRDPSKSATFGPGLHHCIGHLLGRLELDLFFRSLFVRFPDVALVSDAVRFTPNYAFRGVERLPVRLGERAG